MTTDTPSAEALAAELDKRVVTRWVHAVGDTPHQSGHKPDAMCRNAAAMLRALSARVADYETRLSAVMPSDMKDWHQNSRTEWPEVAAAVIFNQRKMIEHDADMIGALSAQVAEAKAERDALRAALDAERERCATICDELEAIWTALKDAALLNGDIALSNSYAGQPRAARLIKAQILGATTPPQQEPTA